MKIRKMFCVLLFISLLLGQYPVGNAVTVKEDEPFKKIQNDKAAEKLIKKAKKSSQFLEAKELAQKKGYLLNGESAAVHLKAAKMDVVYFYLKKKKSDNQLLNNVSFISVSLSQIKAHYIQLAEYDEKGNLHSYFFQNGKLKNKFHINQKGEFLKGSFTYGENAVKQDMMELNKKIVQIDDSEIQTSFNWNKFWDCLKKKSGPNESLPLRSMVLGACYYICFTGPASCIACAVINGGISAGLAGYCVKKVW
ncbi:MULTISPECIES: hypothetical protein [Bacillus]|uniref:hypothetical protein n=1 Tax=Bacillus TaxID=1386 RepID=UPI0005C9D292|nr:MULTISPECIES: hypothetical protein [Bacillus]KAB3541038.1 hypothetical protein F9229_04260 [Bacillus safensis]KAB3546281.1 hypothetical protein F9231_00115 [Bacillus safensis]KIZ53488.1 hypothetical protein UM92_14235 [Bacillus safensis]QNH46604.1 hypothetical protein H7F25_12065 [Bacillus sp. PAMC28571]QNK44461.1 hypothetical protein H7F24_18630 [Bacillus sp. PAMC22265]